jgi:hypothetical protein
MRGIPVPPGPRAGGKRRIDRDDNALSIQKRHIQRESHPEHVYRAARGQEEAFSRCWLGTSQHSSESCHPTVRHPDPVPQFAAQA